jgi:hypothetical protein
MSNKLNGFTVPNNMDPTQQNIENPQQIEQSPLSQSEVGENLTATNSSTRVNTSEIIEDEQKVESRPSSSSQAINETRTVDDAQPVLNNKPIKSELSKMAVLQRQKLGGEVPSSGYGTEVLPFAA